MDKNRYFCGTNSQRMATYKKRGHKPKNKTEAAQAEKQDSATAEVFSTLDDRAFRIEAWVQKRQNYILGVIGAIALGVSAYLGYLEWIQKPKEAEAANALFYPQNHFDQALNNETAQDSLFTLALNGSEGKYGFLAIIETYKNTQAANLAHYASGMAYLKLQHYEKAIAHLEDFTSEDAILGAMATGGIGDAFSQLNQPEQALEYYEKAIAHNTNAYTTPQFLYKAGIVALDLNQKEKALEFFTRINDEFPSAQEANGIEALIGLAQN